MYSYNRIPMDIIMDMHLYSRDLSSANTLSLSIMTLDTIAAVNFIYNNVGMIDYVKLLFRQSISKE